MPNSRENTKTVVRVHVCATSDRAVCLARTKDGFDNKKGTWFPYSQVEIEPDHTRGDHIDVEIADWLLAKSGWDDD